MREDGSPVRGKGGSDVFRGSSKTSIRALDGSNGLDSGGVKGAKPARDTRMATKAGVIRSGSGRTTMLVTFTWPLNLLIDRREGASLVGIVATNHPPTADQPQTASDWIVL